MKVSKRNKRGITLVALIITIIILLILAGISIATLTGSRLFENARLAEQEYKNAQEREEGILEDYENNINKYISANRDSTYCTTPATTTSTASITKPCVVIENYRNGTEWYRVWSDGWIEQGGHSTAGMTEEGSKTSFHKNFKDTNYTINITITPEIVGKGTPYARSIQCQLKTIDSFNISGGWARTKYSRCRRLYI